MRGFEWTVNTERANSTKAARRQKGWRTKVPPGVPGHHARWMEKEPHLCRWLMNLPRGAAQDARDGIPPHYIQFAQVIVVENPYPPQRLSGLRRSQGSVRGAPQGSFGNALRVERLTPRSTESASGRCRMEEEALPRLLRRHRYLAAISRAAAARSVPSATILGTRLTSAVQRGQVKQSLRLNDLQRWWCPYAN